MKTKLLKKIRKNLSITYTKHIWDVITIETKGENKKKIVHTVEDTLLIACRELDKKILRRLLISVSDYFSLKSLCKKRKKNIYIKKHFKYIHYPFKINPL